MKNTIEKSPPKKVSKSDHIIICAYSTHAEILIKELDSRNQDYVIVEEDQETAAELYLSGLEVMSGNPESEHTLEAAGLESAKAVVVNSITDKNVSIIFSVRNINPSIKIVAVLADEEMDTYHKLAGADITISPRQLIGKSLAIQVPAVSINDSVEIDNTIELIEIDIEDGSELCNKSIGEAHLLDQYHINIIGAWLNGEF